MQRFCPYCGTELDESSAPPGSLDGTIACPTCGQEMDRLAPGPVGSPGQEPQAAPPNPFEPPPVDSTLASPFEPPPEASGAETGSGPANPFKFPPPGFGPSLGDPASYAEIEPDKSHPDSPAWEAGPGNLAARLWRTVWQVLLHPARTFAAPALPGVGHALGFGLIWGVIGGAGQTVWNQVLGWPGGGFEGIWSMALAPLFVFISLFVESAVLHFFLWILRGAKRGFTASFRVIGYSQAAGIWFLVPYAGPVLGVIWTLVVLVGGLAAAQGTGRGRVVLAMLLPLFVLLLLTFLIGLAVGLGALFAAFSSAQKGMPWNL